MLNTLLRRVNDKLAAKGHKLDNWSSLRSYYAEEVAKIDEDLLLTPKESDLFFEDETDHLYDPGQCIVMFDKGENNDNDIDGLVTAGNKKMLRTVEICTTMISDHMVPPYFENLARLIGKLEQQK